MFKCLTRVHSQKASRMHFGESCTLRLLGWDTKNILPQVVAPDRGDRDPDREQDYSGTGRGGLCVYIIDAWFSHTVMIDGFPNFNLWHVTCVMCQFTNFHFFRETLCCVMTNKWLWTSYLIMTPVNRFPWKSKQSLVTVLNCNFRGNQLIVSNSDCWSLWFQLNSGFKLSYMENIYLSGPGPLMCIRAFGLD